METKENAPTGTCQKTKLLAVAVITSDLNKSSHLLFSLKIRQYYGETFPCSSVYSFNLTNLMLIGYTMGRKYGT